MNEWKIYKLSEIGTIIGGATPSTSNPHYYGGQIPWITPKDLSTLNGRFIEKGERNITEKGLSSCSAQLLPQGSILFTSRAPIGYVAIAKNPITTNQGFKSIVPNEKVNNIFLYYLMVYNKSNIEAMGSGTTFKEVSGSTMKKVEIRIPNIDVQKRIASILASLDDKIELNRRINDNLEEQAKALFKSWFVDFDRNEWVHCELGDITLITAGGDRPSKYTNKKTIECHVPIYSNGIDNEGLYGYTNVAKIHEESITISARGTIGYVCLRLEPYVPIVRLISIIPNKKELSAKYLYLWALTQNITGTGTTQQQLTVPIFRKTPISIPSDTKLKQFNSIADPLFSQIESNKKENIKLSTLRDTLLPKLMSGEISVEEVSLD